MNEKQSPVRHIPQTGRQRRTRHACHLILVLLWVLFNLAVIPSPVHALQGIDTLNTSTALGTDALMEDYTIAGRAPFPTAQMFNLDFNTLDVNTGAGNLNLDSFSIVGTDFSRVLQADDVFVRRVDNPQASGTRFRYFAEAGVAGNAVNIRPSRPNSIPELMLGSVINRGVLDLFLNVDQALERPNNVERLDVIFTGGITAPAANLLSQAGFIQMEKSGNNPFQIAVVTAIDASGNPTAYGNLFSVPRTAYALTNVMTNNTWFENEANAPHGLPAPYFSQAESLGGVFINLEELGISPGQTIFGYSLFGDDVDQGLGHVLLDPTTFPQDTGGGNNGGNGADLYGGTTGYFLAQIPVIGVAKAAAVSGAMVTLSIRVENFGSTPLSNLSLIDDLDATFGAGTYTAGSPSITTPPATSTVAINPGYTGAAGPTAELLNVANSSLAVGEFAVIEVPVTVFSITDQGNGLGVYSNQAVGAGDPPSGPGDRVTDQSTDGTDPDPNGNGDPTEAPETTPTPVVVTNQPPVATDDSDTTPLDTPVTLSAIANDSDPDGTIDPATVDLDPNTPGRQTTFTVPGEGTFTADDLGNVTFTPELGFTGVSAIPYTVQDDLGATSNPATITITVVAANQPPVATDDSDTTPLDTPVTLSAIANDSDPDGTIDPATVDLDPNTPGRQTTFTVPGEGTFTADDLGNVTFTPELGFTGVSAIPYTVQDDLGATSNPATITITVTDLAPAPLVGVAKAASVAGAVVTLNFRIENFGNVPLSNVSLIDDLDTTFGAGTYTAAPPTISVPPATSALAINAAFTGSGAGAELLDVGTSALAVGEFAIISVTVTVNTLTDQGNGLGIYDNTAIGAGDPPSGPGDRVIDGSSDGTDPDPNDNGDPTEPPENTPSRIVISQNPQPPVARNDAATTPLDTPVTLPVTSNDFDLDGTIDVATVDLDPTTPGRQTTFTVMGQGTYVADDLGNVTFTPEIGFTGVSTTPYTVQDNETLTSNPADITITVTGPGGNQPPVANDDRETTPLDTPVTLSAIGNDSDPDGTIDVATVDLDSNTPGRQTTFTVTGQGTYVADDLDNVTFTPEIGFTGVSTTPYTVQDNDGATSNVADITITVLGPGGNEPPVAVDDSETTPFDTPVTLLAIVNDVDRDGTIDVATVDLDPSTPGRQTTFTVPNEGTYTTDDLGNVTFTPVMGFTGFSTIPYTVQDDDGATSNPADITIAVTGPAPTPLIGVAKAASVSGSVVTLNFRIENFGNVPLSNVSLIDDLDTTFGAGTYTAGLPTISVPPATSGIAINAAFTGSGAGAELLDVANTSLEVGEFAIISMTVTVNSLTDQGNGLGIYDNTAIGAGDPPSGPGDRVTDESSDGTDPDPNDNGDPTDPPENMGPRIVISLDPQPPVARNDAATTPLDTPVTLSAIANDSDLDGTIDVATVDLDPSTPGRQTTFTVTDQGTYVADDLGNVTFTPEVGFSGVSTTPYTVQDDDASTSNAADITITVLGPGGNQPPVAGDDLATTPLDTPVTLSAIGNDSDPDGTIDVATVDLDPVTPGRQTTFSVAGQGTFVADDLGNVTFTPVAGFTGVSMIDYVVQDDDAAISNVADITITVLGPGGNQPPVASNDSETTPFDTPVTLAANVNDVDPDGTVDSATVDLDPATPGRQTTFTVTGQGTYTGDDLGRVTFTPEAGFTGVSMTDYTVQDDQGSTSNVAIITITISGPTEGPEPTNQPPVADDG